jgi:hypothetical protein
MSATIQTESLILLDLRHAGTIGNSSLASQKKMATSFGGPFLLPECNQFSARPHIASRMKGFRMPNFLLLLYATAHLFCIKQHIIKYDCPIPTCNSLVR